MKFSVGDIVSEREKRGRSGEIIQVSDGFFPLYQVAISGVMNGAPWYEERELIKKAEDKPK